MGRPPGYRAHRSAAARSRRRAGRRRGRARWRRAGSDGCGCSESPRTASRALTGLRSSLRAAPSCTRPISTPAATKMSGAGRVDDGRPERIQQAADRRAADDGGLLRGGGGGNGARQQRHRHDAGQDRVHGRNLEGARRSRQEQDGEHRLATEPALRRADRKRERRQRLAGLADGRRPRGGRTGRAPARR